MYLFISIILACVIVLVIEKILFLQKLPPGNTSKFCPIIFNHRTGPWRLPIFGSMFRLSLSNPLVEFSKYKEKYGPICSVGIGNFNVILLNDVHLINEALSIDVFNGRPDFEAWINGNDGVKNRGILVCDANSIWSEQRRFALKNLRDLGFGKQTMEDLLAHESEQLISFFRTECLNKPINLKTTFSAPVINSLWYILTGERFELNNPELMEIMDSITRHLQKAYVTTPALFFPLPIKLLFHRKWKESLKMRKKVLHFMDNVIDEHDETYVDGISRDFIDVYLHQMKETWNRSSSFWGREGRRNLTVVLKDLFVAGVETTSTTLLWSIYYLVTNPDVQKNAQQEIDLCLGKEKTPSREDKEKLIYMEAFINEVHRHCSLLPLSVYHKCTEDIEFYGYLIPKDAVILPNIYEVHHDPKYWNQPEVFSPERFLDSSKTRLIKHESFIPFSTGKRKCIGMNLAHDTLFLFLTGLLQNFKFELDGDDSKYSKPSIAFTFVRCPPDFNVIISER